MISIEHVLIKLSQRLFDSLTRNYCFENSEMPDFSNIYFDVSFSKGQFF